MSDWIESNFITFDGLTLFYRYKKPKNKTKNTLLFLHRGHEHSGRITSFANKLAQDDYWCFSFDLRGHGLSNGIRSWAPNFNTWVKDLNSFSGHIQNEFSINTKDTLLIANSIGSVMAVSWILNYATNLRGCILGAPAFSIKLYIPFALTFLRLVSKISDKKFVTSYVKPTLLTRNKEEADKYKKDPLITKNIGVNVLVTLFDTYINCFNRLKDFEIPTLIFTAGKDYIVNNKTHKIFYNGISSPIKKHILLKNFRHAIFHENEQHKVIVPSQAFIKNIFTKENRSLPAVIPSARQHTIDEHEKLILKTSFFLQIYYSLFRSLLKNIGKFSNGIAIGLKYGFDSGISLDYIYKNKKSGKNWFGRFIDSIYLNSVGWKGIRTRKVHVKNTLMSISKKLNSEGVEPVIFDIASGPGRYLFESQKELEFSTSLYLNDLDKNSIQHAKAISNEFSSENTTFKNRDVFESFHKHEFNKKPNIIIISGLFELYENNYSAYNVVNNMKNIIDNGGYLIYTGQPWHPQLNLIGRILNNRNGKRWIMRTRVQTEIDQLIESSGFNKLGTESDELGIFTVSCAQSTNTINV